MMAVAHAGLSNLLLIVKLRKPGLHFLTVICQSRRGSRTLGPRKTASCNGPAFPHALVGVGAAPYTIEVATEVETFYRTRAASII